MTSSLHPSVLVALALLVSSVPACGPATAELEPAAGTWTGALTQETGFGSNPGGLNMYTYVPAGVPAKAPLVVAMHGCTQPAAAYVGAGWNQLADLWKFYVVYPEQPSSTRCFRWYEAAHNRRGVGDALSIKQMVDRMTATHDIDRSRVFVTGLSAGGAMVPVLLAAYPDVFAAGASMSGIAYRCADSMMNATTCMMSSRGWSAKQWGDLVRSAFAWSGAYPRISIWQGSADYLVAPLNAGELRDQWTDVHGISATPSASDTVSGAAHQVYRSAAGQALVETWSVPGMSHGVAIDPGYSPAGGCGTAGAFILDANVCSTYHAGRFFGLGPAGSTPPPTKSDAGVAPPPGSEAGAPPATNDWGLPIEPVSCTKSSECPTGSVCAVEGSCVRIGGAGKAGGDPGAEGCAVGGAREASPLALVLALLGGFALLRRRR